MKIFNIILKVLLCLILLTPILGAFGVFPAPTADMYNTPQAFAFIQALMESHYINQIMAAACVLIIIFTIMGRTALAALLLLPITINIISFHLFLDGGLFTASASLADILALLNLWFLWQGRSEYKVLWTKQAPTTQA